MVLVEFMVLMCWVLRDHPGSLRMDLAVQLPESANGSLLDLESSRVLHGFRRQPLPFPQSLIRLSTIQPVLGAHDPQSVW